MSHRELPLFLRLLQRWTESREKKGKRDEGKGRSRKKKRKGDKSRTTDQEEKNKSTKIERKADQRQTDLI